MTCVSRSKNDRNNTIKSFKPFFSCHLFFIQTIFKVIEISNDSLTKYCHKRKDFKKSP